MRDHDERCRLLLGPEFDRTTGHDGCSQDMRCWRTRYQLQSQAKPSLGSTRLTSASSSEEDRESIISQFAVSFAWSLVLYDAGIVPYRSPRTVCGGESDNDMHSALGGDTA